MLHLKIKHKGLKRDEIKEKKVKKFKDRVKDFTPSGEEKRINMLVD